MTDEPGSAALAVCCEQLEEQEEAVEKEKAEAMAPVLLGEGLGAVDPAVVEQLVSMGFSRNGRERGERDEGGREREWTPVLMPPSCPLACMCPCVAWSGVWWWWS